MKKLGTFLVVLAVSMFALGCGGKTGDKTKTPEKTKTPATDTDKTKTGEGEKTKTGEAAP